MPELTADEKKAQAKKAAEVKKTADTRVGRAISAIKAVGTLNRYKLTTAQQKACIEALQKAVVEATKQISSDKAKASDLFSLPD